MAYYDARRHKRNKPYQQRFEDHAEENLRELCDELWNHTYQPRPSTCFIITDPKRREVFAAQFRDRIVHHLYYNYTHEMLERTFIDDSYSCIKKRGTHYGIQRLESHIRKESQNYAEQCYVLKMDVRGYFMHINRQRLLDITITSLRRMAKHKVGNGASDRWRDRVDMILWNTYRAPLSCSIPWKVVAEGEIHYNGRDSQDKRACFIVKRDVGYP